MWAEFNATALGDFGAGNTNISTNPNLNRRPTTKQSTVRRVAHCEFSLLKFYVSL